MTDCGCHVEKVDSAHRRILWTALTLNAAMFVIEGFAGWKAESTGLLADALDMLSDAGCLWSRAHCDWSFRALQGTRSHDQRRAHPAARTLGDCRSDPTRNLRKRTAKPLDDERRGSGARGECLRAVSAATDAREAKCIFARPGFAHVPMWSQTRASCSLAFWWRSPAGVTPI